MMSKRRSIIIAAVITAMVTLFSVACAPKDVPVTEKFYTVTFEANGGAFTDGSTQTKLDSVKGGSTVAAPAVSREDYDFVGWHTDLAATNKVDLSTYKITSDISFFAGWQKSDGDDNDPSNDDDNKQATLDGIEVTPPTKTEYVQGQTVSLDGLVVTANYSDDTSKTVASGEYTLSPSTIDTSTVGTKTVTVTYEGKTATFNITVIAKKVESLEVSGNLVKTTYNLGESFDPNGLIFTATYNDVSTQPVDVSNITFSPAVFNTAGTAVAVTATFEGKSTTAATVTVNDIQSYLVKFDDNKGKLGAGNFIVKDMPQNVNIVEGETVPAPSKNPELKGYDFSGWYTDRDCMTSFAFGSSGNQVNSPVTLYAKWTANNVYAITYDLNDGALVSGQTNPSQFTVTDNKFQKITLNNPEKQHYNFSGWFTAQSGGTRKTEITYDDIPADGNTIRLYARYTPKTYTITYDFNGETGDKFTVSKNGSFNKQWTVDYTYGTEVDLLDDGDLTISKIDAGDTTEYNFAGWLIKGASKPYQKLNGTKLSPTNGGTGNITLVPDISSKPLIDFTFNMNYGSPVETQTVKVRAEEEKVTEKKISDPTRLGYTFDGWYDQTTGGNLYNFDVYLLSDCQGVTVYARWTINTYNISYDLTALGGTSQANPATYKITDGTNGEVTLTDPTGMTNGYYFLGWFTDSHGTQKVEKLDDNFINGKTAGSTTTLYARFDNRYTATFNDNASGETVTGTPGDQTKAYNSKLDKPTDPTRVDYTFGGWFREVGYTTEWDFDNDVLTANTMLYAKWTENVETGWYLVPTGATFDRTTSADYELDGSGSALTTKNGISLALNGSFVIFHFNKADGVINYRNVTTIEVTPAAAMTITVDTTDDKCNVYKVTGLNVSGATWSISCTATTLELVMDGYYDTYTPSGTKVGLTEEAAAQNTPYIVGNFTNNKTTKEWREIATNVNGKYYFQNVTLRKYDTFGIKYNGKTVTGVESATAGTYNIVFDPAGEGSVVLHPVSDSADADFTINASKIFVDDTAATITDSRKAILVTLNSVEIPSSDYVLILSTAVSGNNANTVKVIYKGRIIEKTYTATEVAPAGIEVKVGTGAIKQYTWGDTPSKNGLTVVLKYNNGNTHTLAAGDYTLALVGTGSKENPYDGAEGSVEVTYTPEGSSALKTSYAVTIFNKITSIAVTVNKVGGISFIEDQPFALANGDITVTAYFNGTTAATAADKRISAELDSTKYTTNPAVDDTLVLGTDKVTVSTVADTTVRAEFDITVSAKKLHHLTVDGNPTKTNYKVGDKLDLTGLTVTAHFDNGTTANVTNEVSVYNNGSVIANRIFTAAADITSLTFEYSYNNGSPATVDKTLTDNITVSNILSSIAVTTVPDVPREGTAYEGYVAGDPFTYTGMVVTATYNSNVLEGKHAVSNPVTGYTVSIAKNTALTAGENQTVTVTYTENGATKTATFEINVAELKVVGLDINVPETPVNQYVGRVFNPDGYTFRAVNNNGESVVITDLENVSYSCTDVSYSKESGFGDAHANATVTVTYKGLSKAITGVVIIDAATYTVDFKYNIANTVSGPSDKLIVHGETVGELTDPQCNGFTFDDWYTDNTYTTKFDVATKIRANTTIYGKFIAIDYILRFTVDGKISSADYKAVNNVFADVALNTLIADPTKTGYEFVGWRYADTEVEPFTTFTQALIVIDHVTVSGGYNYIDLVPVFGAIKYDVTFDSKGGSTVDGARVEYNGVVTKPNDPTRDHYTFGGWFKEEAYTTEWNFATDKVTGATTLYAKWTAVEYTVTFDANGGTLAEALKTAKVTVETVDSFTLPTPTAPDNKHRFAGWKKGGTTVTAVLIDWFDNNTTSVTLTAAYEEIVNFKVTFNLNYTGAPAATVVEVESGKAIAESDIPAPTRTGYTFGGWFTDDKCTTEWNKGDLLTADVTVYAKWTNVTYKVTFDANGGTGAPTAKDIAENSLIEEPTVKPTKEGSRFDGWYKEKACTTKWDFDTDKVTTETTLYAKWVAVATVTFDLNLPAGKTAADVTNAPKAKTVDVNTVITAPTPAPSLNGYAFNGWFTDKAGKTQWMFADTDKVTKPMTLYAKWTKVSDGKMTVLSSGKSTEMDMLDNTDNMSTTEKQTYDKNYAFFGEHKVTLKTNDVLTFKVSGTAISFTLDTYSKNVELVSGTPTKLKVKADGSYDIYLKRNKTTQKWEIYASGGPVLDGDYFIAGTFNSWTTNSNDYKFNKLDGSKTLYMAKGETFKLVHGETWIGYSCVKTETKYLSGSEDSDIEVLQSGKFKLVYDGEKLTITREGAFVESTITFDAQSGSFVGVSSPVMRQTVDGKISEAKLPEVKRDGYVFGGWYTEANGKGSLVTATAFYSNATVYASWTKEGESTEPSIPDYSYETVTSTNAYLVGAFNGGSFVWEKGFKMISHNGNEVKVEGFTVKANAGVKVRYGGNNYGYDNVHEQYGNKNLVSRDNDGNMVFNEAGTYNIYFDTSTKSIYLAKQA